MTQRLLVLLTLVFMAEPRQSNAQSLRGVVVYAKTRAPVPGAALVLSNETGTVVTRLSSDSLGRFTLPAGLRGFYVLEATTPAHETLGHASSLALTLPDTSSAVLSLPSAEEVASSLCDAPGGIVAGTVRARSDALPGDNVKIVVQWDSGRSSTEARTDARGRFRVCGVPVDAPLLVRAATDSGDGAGKQVRIAPNERLTIVELAGTAKSPARTAQLSGVVRDEKGRAISEAEVSLPKIARNTFTDTAGAFRITDLPSGLHDLAVRRIGYRELTMTVSADQSTREQQFVLSSVATLDTVSVTASVVIQSFEEHRALGLGKFLTRAVLEKQENRKMAEILEQVGAKALRNGHRAWIGGSGGRGVKSLVNKTNPARCSVLEGREQGGIRNPGCGCFSLVYLNGALLYNGESHQTVPDINAIVPASIEAIEYYKGPSQTPARYSALNAECGVVVLHTRRTPGSAILSKP